MSPIVVPVYPSQLAQFKQKSDLLADKIQLTLNIKVSRFTRYDSFARGIGYVNGHDRLIENSKSIAQGDKSEPLRIFSDPVLCRQIGNSFEQHFKQEIALSVERLCRDLGIDESIIDERNHNTQTVNSTLPTWLQALIQHNTENKRTIVFDLTTEGSTLDGCIDHDLDFRSWEGMVGAEYLIDDHEQTIELFNAPSPSEQLQIPNTLISTLKAGTIKNVIVIGDITSFQVSKEIGDIALSHSGNICYRYFNGQNMTLTHNPNTSVKLVLGNDSCESIISYIECIIAEKRNEGASNSFVICAIELVKALIPILCELRDKNGFVLSINYIRKYLSAGALTDIIHSTNNVFLPQEEENTALKASVGISQAARNPLVRFLANIMFDKNKSPEDQHEATNRSLHIAFTYFKEALDVIQFYSGCRPYFRPVNNPDKTFALIREAGE